ncbi:hypothetical protein [Pseudomonas sp. NPDC089758]|uniref:hypothetical protein n=1 Tax=Pseudomonas sp. NPDC089758 TaxID=3364473 RepID=UPI0038274A31
MNDNISFEAFHETNADEASVLYIAGAISVLNAADYPVMVPRTAHSEADVLEVDLMMETREYPQNTKGLRKLLKLTKVPGYTGEQIAVQLYLHNVLVATATIRPGIVATIDN